jgi:hypothetical protein
MIKEELECLVEEKKREGKSDILIDKEIKRLKKSQIVFKEQKNEAIKLNKQIELLKKERDNLRKRLMSFELNQGLIRQEKDKEGRHATIKDIKRVLITLKENKPMGKTEIKRFCLFGSQDKVSECLDFLVSYKFAIKSKLDGMDKYSLNVKGGQNGI